MAETKVIMPQMGESIFEGTITKWLKKKGDQVQRDEPLFEISTDKIDSEIPAPTSGVLQDILVKEGQTVQINTVVAVIGDGSSKPSSAPVKDNSQSKSAPKEATPQVKTEAKTDAGRETRASAPPAADRAEAPGGGDNGEKDEEFGAEDQQESVMEESGQDEPRSSPLVRRIAKEHGVELAALAGKGTGLGGRITKRDILSFIEQGAPQKKEAAARKSPPEPAVPSPMKFTSPWRRILPTHAAIHRVSMGSPPVSGSFPSTRG
jgi:2-oxoglutarate dehydrogenase E2 component (dihydrolipoamide succinyltransferase)